jgi:tetratricopeptide (TPR) repeat protein
MYKKALELDPKLVDASINLSALLLDANDAAGALKVVDNALKLAPKEKGLLTNRALALEATGNKDEAVKAYGAAVEAGGDDPQLRIAYAQLLAESGRKEQALEQLRKLGPIDNPQLAAAAANTFGRLKAFADCVGVLDKAIASKPAPDLLVRRGVCRMENGDTAGEKADYEAAIKLDPKFAPAYYYLGKHLLAKGDKKGAQANFEKAVETGGDTPPAKEAKEELAKLKGGASTAKAAPAPKKK